MLPVGVVLDPSVCVVVRELGGRSGPVRAREREKSRHKKVDAACECDREGPINPSTHTSHMNSQESHEESDTTRHRCMAL